MRQFTLLELFSGSGVLSRVARARGWQAVTVDIDARGGPTIVGDVREALVLPHQPSVLWASPPCTEYSDADPRPAARTRMPDLTLWRRVEELVSELEPELYAIENVRGAQRWHGPAPWVCHPYYLWGRFPWFSYVRDPALTKTRHHSPRLRARLPEGLCHQFVVRCEYWLQCH